MSSAERSDIEDLWSEYAGLLEYGITASVGLLLLLSCVWGAANYFESRSSAESFVTRILNRVGPAEAELFLQREVSAYLSSRNSLALVRLGLVISTSGRIIAAERDLSDLTFSRSILVDRVLTGQKFDVRIVFDFRRFIQLVAALVFVFGGLFYLALSRRRNRVGNVMRVIDAEVKRLIENLSLIEKPHFVPGSAPTSRSVDFGKLRELSDIWRARLEESRAQLIQVASDRALLELSRRVAHDIRGPIGALKIGLRSLRNGRSGGSDLVDASIVRIEAIANDLLDSTRKTAPEGVTSSDLYRMILSFERSFVFRGKVKVSVQRFPEGGKECFLPSLDLGRLDRVFVNLFNNALEAGASLIAISFFLHSGRFTIEVTDNGFGMPGWLIEQLGRNEISFGKAKGNGIGVVAVFEYIKSISGTVEYESLDIGGTRVRINLNAVPTESFGSQALSYSVSGDD